MNCFAPNDATETGISDVGSPIREHDEQQLDAAWLHRPGVELQNGRMDALGIATWRLTGCQVSLADGGCAVPRRERGARCGRFASAGGSIVSISINEIGNG